MAYAESMKMVAELNEIDINMKNKIFDTVLTLDQLKNADKKGEFE
jgi:hypothetical protein